MSTITTNKLRSQTIIQPTTPIFGLGKDISNPSLKKRILSLIFYFNFNTSTFISLCLFPIGQLLINSIFQSDQNF